MTEGCRMRLLVIFLSLLLASGSRAEIKVLDDLSREVTLAAPAQRIVSLAPHLTEVMFYLGIGDKVVGTVRFSDFPAEASKIPIVGDAFAVSVEAIVKLDPDLVVAWSSGGNDAVVEKIKSLGFPVYYSEPRTLAGVAESAAHIATLAGRQRYGRELAEKFRVKLDKLRRSPDTRDRPRVFFQISSHDLYTVNAHHLIGQVISLCGGENIFASSQIPVPLVSNESVLLAEPEIIIFSSGLHESPHWKERWSKFEAIPAVANDRLFEMSADLITRPGFRMLEGIEQLCNIISEAGNGRPSKISAGD